MKRWRLHAFGALLVALVLAWALFAHLRRGRALRDEESARARQQDAGPVVSVVRVRPSTSERSITLPADVRAIDQTTLYAKVSGYVERMLVDKGSRVKKGELLATISSPEIEQGVVSARASMENLRAILDRQRLLFAQALIARQDLDQAEASFRVAQAAYEQAIAQREYQSIRAPFAGTITARYVDPGALLPAATGATASALPVVDLADLDRLRLSIYVGQDVAPSVHPGAAVTIAGPDRTSATMAAAITRTAGALDPRTRTMLCEIEIANREGMVLPGSFVEVTLRVRTEALPSVPLEALFQRQGKYLVAVLDGDRLHFEPVQPGRMEIDTVQVIAAGLAPDTLVALNVPTELEDGARVRPVELAIEGRGGGPAPH